ncbi:TPA: acyltransferase [Klebsiella pneumoniae subsp. pneumoniae]|uniref:acyltransferase family protein n=2 Tax=Klebsiella pneumoniae TaxID=573 RepID=UPI0007CCED32|nr:acyltransferase [Klebsiella pneumoniae]HBQ5871425.1 acyltransferase [Klebsiella pneumoniae subsp. pneumoniae]EIX9761965.1 acyltransferase [Klebsiella pneumoniae]RBQ54398.1 acyltransferase [Klebsiella pneumoniae]SBI93140.1 acyltransferase 3 [Klebsiella pneumoniae]SWM91035.1 acyltransferase 3 [Klebsiella pneumoniae]
MKNELNQIQWLRAIAAILVVITHFTGKAYSVKLLDHEFSSGAIGVDIFFIISGFIMMYVSDLKKQYPIKFILNRFIRILPVHYFFLFILIIIFLIKPDVINSSVSKTYVWESFLLVPALRNDAEYLNPVIWTLCYEMMFYLIFCVSLNLKNLTTSAIATTLVISAIVFSGFFYKGDNIYISAATDSISLEFCYGMLLYIFYKKGFLTFHWLLPLMLSIILYFVLKQFDFYRFIKLGIPSALIFISFLNMKNSKITFLNFLGKISYEIYICHIMVISASYLILFRLGVFNIFAYATLTSVLILISAYLINIFISNKALSLKKKFGL